MSRKQIAIWTVLAVVAGALLVTPALSQSSATTMPAATTQPSDATGMMSGCMKMMQQGGMSKQMLQRMDAMMKTPIFLDSPSAIYGQAQRLNLTDEQKQQLRQIENEARKKALAVLTAEQRKDLGQIPATPMPMMQMKSMMKKMGGKDQPMMCPMGK